MPTDPTRRGALTCLGFGAGTLFAISCGVLSAIPLSQAAAAPLVGRPLFVQISDTHIGFDKAANPDVPATLERTIDLVNALPVQPGLVLHTGDITHRTKAKQFDRAHALLSWLRPSELHTTPGEHDMTDSSGAEYFARFGTASQGKGYYSFDHDGTHVIALGNVMHFKPNGPGAFGDDQLAWRKDDLNGRSASQSLVIFTHMPMWTIYESWGRGASDADQVLSLVRRFG